MASMSPTASSDVVPGLSSTFAECSAADRAALVLYLTAGHPAREDSLGVLEAVAEAGADVIELGIPFSDPLADGPVIQLSSHQALAAGASLGWTLELLASFRERSQTPVVLFSYLNPIFRYGVERFLADAAAAGAQGVLLTDLPADSDAGIERQLLDSPLDLVRLIAPTTPPARAREIAASTQGFVYYISRTGVTGAGTAISGTLESEVDALRQASPVPVAVGFGISRPEQARRVAAVADGVVVGSALVQTAAQGGAAAAAAFTARLREAMQR